MARGVLVEPQRRGEGPQHLRGGMPVDALLQPGQVRLADAGQAGQLLAAQPGGTPPALFRQAGVRRAHACPARLEELAEEVVDRHPAKGNPARVLARVHRRRDGGGMKTWFITGASRGFGNVWTDAALARGDRVAATARRPETLEPLAERYGDRLLPLALDVTDRSATFDAVARAADAFGSLDVVVNNAGYGLFGMVEETSEEQARALLETNFFGALWVTQAALPILRGQGHGHLLQVSSIGGVAAFPSLGLYNASKWALEGMSEALAQEVAPHGVRVTILEPGPYGTDWSGDSAVRTEPIAAYDPVREARRAAAAGHVPVDPAATADVVLGLVDAPEPPLRLFVGGYPYPVAEAAYRQRLATWDDWRWLAEKG